MIKRIFVLLLAFVAAVLATYVLGAAAATQSVLASLGEMGVSVPLGDRIAATWHDLLGMFQTYASIIAVAFVIGFAVAALIIAFLPGWRTFGYVAAGLVAVIAAHLILRQVFEVTGVAAARTLLGLSIQGLAGAVGGYVFARLAPGRRAAGA